MRQKVFDTIKRYAPLFLANILCTAIFGVLMWWSEKNGHDPDQYISGIQLFILILVPIYFAVHGVLSYVLTKKVLLPNFVLFVFLWIFVPLATFDFRLYLLFTVQWLFVPVLGFSISVVMSFFAMIFHKFLFLDPTSDEAKKKR